MARITSIKPQRNKKRVNIYLDGKFAFGIDLENFVKLRLRVEQELSEEDVEKIVKEAEFQKTLDKLLRFSMTRPRSKKEVADWFRRKKVHESMHEKLFDKLKHFELLDDDKFAKWWVEQRLAFSKKSLRVIKQELAIKGISKDAVEDALAQENVDEGKKMMEVLAKKAYRWEKLSERERRQKMSEYLLRQGFGWEEVSSVIDDFEAKR